MTDFLGQFESKKHQGELQKSTASESTLKPILQEQSNVSDGIKTIEHHVEFDSGYKRGKTRRWLLVAAIIIAVGLLAFLVLRFSNLVEIPDFNGKPLSIAQVFCDDNGIILEIDEVYQLDSPEKTILSQSVSAGESIKKGSVLTLTISKGPNPSEHLALPDFSTMKRTAAEQWISNNRADNIRLVLEYSDSIAKDEFLRLEFNGNDTSIENYQRKDYATLYYSKGKETFEKNIIVPDFEGKSRDEAKAWAQENSIDMTFEEISSDTIEVDCVITQSVRPGEKLAKHDALLLTVSLGKPFIVPNFSLYTVTEAIQITWQIPVTIQTRFNLDIAYGLLISQSIPSGTQLLPGDERQINVVYSEGPPYLKDYRGISEGDLPELFYNDYTSKGADVTYELIYVDSSEIKGTVVSMSDYCCFIPMEFHVKISVSRGNITPPPQLLSPQPDLKE